MLTKRCPKCGETKELLDFPPHKNMKYGVNSYCRICKNANNVKLQKARRLRALEYYGKVCACCGEDKIEFLAFDHVRGGGNQERKERRHFRVARDIYDMKYSWGEIRVLCHNCNLSLGYYGYCPHHSSGAVVQAEAEE